MDEFNLNLATVKASLEGEKVRGTFAVQAGSSVDANYSAEPHDGLRYLQEAFVGYRLAENTIFDAGIFFSHIGTESFVSRDNLTYTRSLSAEFSPYYQSGLRLAHSLNSQVKGEVLVVRGWQNISDDRRPALGTKVTYLLSNGVEVGSATFFGDEEGARLFHNGFLTATVESWKFSANLDGGYQDLPGSSQVFWWGATAIIQRKLSDLVAAAIRFEHFADPDSVQTTPPRGLEFRVSGASLNVDITLPTSVPNLLMLWRNEARVLYATEDIFSRVGGRSKTEGVFVTSLAVGF